MKPWCRPTTRTSTFELADRFVILPLADPRLRDAYLHDGATPVPDGFSYCSDTNAEALDARTLQDLIGRAFAA